MRLWGKVIGSLIGLVLTNSVLGGLFGLWLGHRMDKRYARSQLFRYRPTRAEQQIFFRATFSTMGHMAKAKGVVTQLDIAFAQRLMDEMRLSPETKVAAQEAFREGKEADFPLRSTLQQVKATSGQQRDLLYFFLEIQLKVAFSDGELAGQEQQIVQTIAEVLGFSARELQQAIGMCKAESQFRHYRQQQQEQGGGGHSRQRYAERPDPRTQGQRLQAAYAILGATSQDNDQTIKRAYRKLLNQHHPDKLAAKGLAPEMMEMAKEKTQEIQDAWEIIKEARGIK